MPRRSPKSNTGKVSAGALERVARDNRARALALRLELRELDESYTVLARALGPERADALALDARVRWQRETALCAICFGPCDDHPDIEPFPRREEDPP